MGTDYYGQPYWGFGNSAKIQPLSTYDQAKEHFEKVIPIRGRSDDTKPLGKNRRYTWYRICKNTIAIQSENREYNTYACNLYGTDIVEFYPDGEVRIYTRGWHTPTTLSFVNYTCREFGVIVSIKGSWHWLVRATGKYYPIPNATSNDHRNKPSIRLKPNADGVLEPIDKPQRYKYVVSRKGINAVRREFSHFINYAKTTLSISPAVEQIKFFQTNDASELSRHILGIDLRHSQLLPRRWYGTHKDYAKENREALFKALQDYKQSNDATILYEAFRLVAGQAGRMSYRDNTIYCSPLEFARYFDEMLKHSFRDRIFVAKEVAEGIGFHDENAKYMQQD